MLIGDVELQMPRKWGYWEYMRSVRWEAVKRRYYGPNEEHKYCFSCKTRDGTVDMHHASYENLGYETYREIVPLCRRCHKVVHIIEKVLHQDLMWATKAVIRSKFSDTEDVYAIAYELCGESMPVDHPLLPVSKPPPPPWKGSTEHEARFWDSYTPPSDTLPA